MEGCPRPRGHCSSDLLLGIALRREAHCPGPIGPHIQKVRAFRHVINERLAVEIADLVEKIFVSRCVPVTDEVDDEVGLPSVCCCDDGLKGVIRSDGNDSCAASTQSPEYVPFIPCRNRLLESQRPRSIGLHTYAVLPR